MDAKIRAIPWHTRLWMHFNHTPLAYRHFPTGYRTLLIDHTLDTTYLTRSQTPTDAILLAMDTYRLSWIRADGYAELTSVRARRIDTSWHIEIHATFEDCQQKYTIEMTP